MLVGLNFNKIIGKFADFYFLFLLDVIDLKTNTIPPKFILLTTILGSLIGKHVSIYLDFSVIVVFVVVFCSGLFTALIIYGVLVGSFLLATRYAKSWGNTVFSYLINKASLTVKKKLGVNSTVSLEQKVNIKSCLKKTSKFGMTGGLKKPQKKNYSK